MTPPAQKDEFNLSYHIGLMGFSKNDTELSLDLVNEIESAYNYIQFIESIEERFDILINNYSEFEKMLHRITLQDVVFHNNIVPDMLIMKRKMARVVNNLLSSCRLFLDQTEKRVKAIDMELSDKLSKRRRSFYDQYFSYRLFEYLRNAMQHSVLPLGVSFNRNWMQIKNKVVASFDVELDIKLLVSEDKKFINKIKSDLDDLHSDQIGLKVLIREYVSCFSELISLIRKETDEHFRTACIILENTFKTYDVMKISKENEIQIFLDTFEINSEELKILRKRMTNAILKNIKYLRDQNIVNRKYESIVIQN